MISEKDSRNKLSDEDILNGINSIDYSNNNNNKIEDTPNNEVQANDFVDSSLFVMDDLKQKNIIKNEPVAPGNRIEKKQNSPVNSFRDTTREKAPVAEEPIQEENVIVSKEDAITIQGSEADTKSGFKWIVGILILIILTVAGGTVYMILDNKKEEIVVGAPEININQSQESNSFQEVQIIEEKKEEQQKIDLSKMKINVYNGSGVAGAAGKIKDLLNKEKYESVEAKNYTSDKVVESVLYYKEDVLKEEAQKIADFLKTGNVEMQIKLASKDEEKTADIVIVLGK